MSGPTLVPNTNPNLRAIGMSVTPGIFYTEPIVAWRIASDGGVAPVIVSRTKLSAVFDASTGEVWAVQDRLDVPFHFSDRAAYAAHENAMEIEAVKRIHERYVAHLEAKKKAATP